ncbi:class I SAM-dependent methyltransferase [Chromobacterium haemolyticum]|uniref:Class I SAM-dependent methyltransferase n=1 Tax=Chromobacterium fluminis TaxID=3044269 RepID=A0ABX0L7K7_9NEIS|nr:class I SAM-dependent methyltransferase [Chromobacterium haemolyticum]NHR06998.1 class I SAM-dependent methyltransferase [Chromobacterium haemolyticum]
MTAAGFDGVYRSSTSFYGDKPSPSLVQYLEKYHVAGGGAGLDLGCGQGRNALYLAQRGFAMTAVDGSAEAIASLGEAADERRLNVSGRVADLAGLELEPARYRLIVANTSLDHLGMDEGEALARQMSAALEPGGYLFVSVFMVDDPGCDAGGRVASETASYVKHYYQPGELRGQFSTLSLLAYQEEYALDVGHGQPHYHGIARLFARRDH